MKKINWIIVFVVVISLLSGCSFYPGIKTPTKNPSPSATPWEYEENTPDSEAEDIHTEEPLPTAEPTPKSDFGRTITFDGFEITVNKGYLFTNVKNQFSEQNGKDVIELPVHVKNIGDETDHLNTFEYTFFGPKGTELDNVSAYFDNDIFRAGDLRSSAEYDTYFHLLYEGDGSYFIEFNDWSSKIELEFDITKS